MKKVLDKIHFSILSGSLKKLSDDENQIHQELSINDIVYLLGIDHVYRSWITNLNSNIEYNESSDILVAKSNIDNLKYLKQLKQKLMGCITENPQLNDKSKTSIIEHLLSLYPKENKVSSEEDFDFDIDNLGLTLESSDSNLE